ncbi:unnamed protein product [Ambrosiozyma monospora]|uniref:Unnamed protein product n=1 Tax=Ambrosiozyma monospora TaxID=43982 RepID=A0ACB5T527_AMBMO|nr:unnamed protein product [Ambrosiozyma monospora]
MLTIPHSSSSTTGTGSESFNFTIMTYNLLAQALIRRKLFPTNGDILKWSKRCKVLITELKHYNSDILCVQEMDYIQYNSYWKVELGKLGYLNKYYRSGIKNHGVAIFYKESLFNFLDISHVDYDNEETGKVLPRTTTTNVGLILSLNLKKDPSKALLIGTTHLFWHPFGTYERTRQTYVVLRKMKELQSRLKILHPEITKSWMMFAGDFNSQPFDSPYLSITSKPIEYDGRCKTVISCSTSFTYSSLREGGSGEEEEGGNIEKFGENQPKDPVPESFQATEEQLKLVQDMQDLHNSLPLRAISLYSVAYKLVDPKNAGLDNDRGEPFFSNWAHTWRGLLDYIFVIRDWDVTSDNSKVDKLEDFEEENGIIINKLLKLPHKDEMGAGQPREGEYPSDHLCMIADLTLKW